MAQNAAEPPREMADGALQPHIRFLRGGATSGHVKVDSSEAWKPATEAVRKELSDAMASRNIAFLLGSGCSSLVTESRQVGIPTMAPLAKEFSETLGKRADQCFVTVGERRILLQSLGIDLAAPEYRLNLERLIEVLESFRFALSRSGVARHEQPLRVVSRVLSKLQRFLLQRCTEGLYASSDDSVVRLYESFYRKLLFRDRSLPRPWVFTTNYDLFNETAMDRLGVPYCNGFSGVVERRFNPAVFRYALAEQLDITSRKWTAVDGFVYLCKLHGSVSWTEDGHGLYPIKETLSPGSNERIMIYPTPAKQRASLGSPYADLFREFHSRIVREQSVLFTMGYSFGDEHVNSIIYQALTIPTFRLVIFADPAAGGEIGKLRALEDPRVWIISGTAPDSTPAHYFKVIVESLMPEPPGDRVDSAIERVVERLIAKNPNPAQE